MSVTYTFLGHATHLLDVGGTRIVIDPFLTGNPQAPLSADDLNVDVILVSHGHADHIGDTIPLAQRTGAKVISNAEIVGWLERQGLPSEQLHPQHIGGGFNHNFGRVKFTMAFHGSGLPDGSYGGNPAGLLLNLQKKQLYFACDTALFSDMQLYASPQLDLAVLPIGDNFTMGPDDALEAVKYLQPQRVVPCHYNTWPFIEQDDAAWKRRVEAETKCPVHLMTPGAMLILD